MLEQRNAYGAHSSRIQRNKPRHSLFVSLIDANQFQVSQHELGQQVKSKSGRVGLLEIQFVFSTKAMGLQPSDEYYYLTTPLGPILLCVKANWKNIQDTHGSWYFVSLVATGNLKAHKGYFCTWIAYNR